MTLNRLMKIMVLTCDLCLQHNVVVKFFKDVIVPPCSSVHYMSELQFRFWLKTQIIWLNDMINSSWDYIHDPWSCDSLWWLVARHIKWIHLLKHNFLFTHRLNSVVNRRHVSIISETNKLYFICTHGLNFTLRSQCCWWTPLNKFCFCSGSNSKSLSGILLR